MKRYPSHNCFIGIFLILASFFSWLLPLNNLGIILSQSLFFVGNILLFDYLSYRFSHVSLLYLSRFHRKTHFLLIGLLFGVGVEFYAHWIGKLWYFPYWSSEFYVLILVPGFAIYAFYLIETYCGVRALVYHFSGAWKRHYSHLSLEHPFAFLLRKDTSHRHYWKRYELLFDCIGFIGSIGLTFSTIALLLHTTFSNLNSFFSVNFPVYSPPSILVLLIITSVSFWLLMEYIEYRNHETSMIYELLQGNLLPIASVFLAGWGSALLYETLNTYQGLWRYANFPFTIIPLIDLPLLVVILWPFHYLPLFSIYRVLFKKETDPLWE